jgi:peptidyl-prolyl cis-trans isomerase SurA
VGDYIVLDSDIDKSFSRTSPAKAIRSRTSPAAKCFCKLLEDKLYAHQAVQDSIIVTDDEVKSKMDEQVNYMVEQGLDGQSGRVFQEGQ